MLVGQTSGGGMALRLASLVDGCTHFSGYSDILAFLPLKKLNAQLLLEFVLCCNVPSVYLLAIQC